MRLSSEQREAIRVQAKKFCQSHLVEVYLYGSRTNDSLKGGDIDLIFVVKEDSLQEIQAKLYAILSQLKKETSIGDRRIDLKIVSPELLKSDAFLKTIKSDMVEI